MYETLWGIRHITVEWMDGWNSNNQIWKLLERKKTTFLAYETIFLGKNTLDWIGLFISSKRKQTRNYNFPSLTIFHYIYFGFQNNSVTQLISTVILSLHGQLHTIFVAVSKTLKCMVQTCQGSHRLKNCLMSQNKIRTCLQSCHFLAIGNNEHFSPPCSFLFTKTCM